MNTPFYYGDSLPPEAFLGRERLVKKISGRIKNGRQSSALIGEPRIGKTSLLRCLEARQNDPDLFGKVTTHLTFSYIDAQSLPYHFDQAQFWRQALRPLAEKVEQVSELRFLQNAYLTCQENNYGMFVLERLFAQMAQAGEYFVLLLDEFDVLLDHPVLNKAEFFGGLRGLASLNRGALALVIAIRSPLDELNRATQEFNRTGSPYFNTFSEFTVGAFSDNEVDELLDRAAGYFQDVEIDFIRQQAGRHPYLLQVAAATLLDTCEAGENDPGNRFREVADALFAAAITTMGAAWRIWTPEMKKAFAVVGLSQLPHLLKEESFDLDELEASLKKYSPELRQLALRGLISSDIHITGGWRVTAKCMLWWLAEELIRMQPNHNSFGTWLRENEWDGLLTNQEKKQLLQAVNALTGILKGSVESFINISAEGWVKN